MIKKFLGDMLEYINIDTKNAERDCFAFKNKQT